MPDSFGGIPLSYAQRRLWLLDRFASTRSNYNTGIVVEMHGNLVPQALDAALADVVRRHEILRTVYPRTSGEPVQRVLPVTAGLGGLSRVESIAREGLDAAVADAVRAEFDLAREIPMRSVLLPINQDEYVLVLVAHHIALDGWSVRPLLRDLSEAYTARLGERAPDWSELPVQYTDYALWQRETLGNPADPGSLAQEQLSFWRSQLRALPAQLKLPYDRVRRPDASYRGGAVHFRLDQPVAQRLAGLAAQSGATLFMVLHAGVAALFFHLGAGTDIPLGTVVAGRRDSALDELVGFFVNTLVLRVDLSGNPTLRGLVERVRHTSLAAFDNQDLPFDRVVEALNPPRMGARHPLFQTMVVLQENRGGKLALPGLDARADVVESDSAKFDLYFELQESADGKGLTGLLNFATDLWDASTAHTLADCYVRILEAMAFDPAVPVAQLVLPAKWAESVGPDYSAATHSSADRRLEDPAADTTDLESSYDARWQLLCGVFAETLGLESVAPDSDFFDLGGHSLLAARLAARVRSMFKVEVDLGLVFRAPTVRLLAEAIGEAARARTATRPDLRQEHIPVSTAQRRLWLVDQIQGPSPSYNVTLAYRLHGPVDFAALNAALNDVVRRHEALRSVFYEVDGEPYQRIVDRRSSRVALGRSECSERQLVGIYEDRMRHAFDLAAWPLMRAHLCTITPDNHVLLIIVHHIVFDGWSEEPFLQDLNTAYTARAAGREPAWPVLPIQYTDYVLWQLESLKERSGEDLEAQLEFWRGALESLPDESTLPHDRARPDRASSRNGAVGVRIGSALHRDLSLLARQSAATVLMLVQAGFAAVLTGLGTGTDVCIGASIADRPLEEGVGLVGFFVNNVVLRISMKGDPTFRQLVRRVRESSLAAYAHPDVPFEKLVQEVNPPRVASRNPLYQVSVSLDRDIHVNRRLGEARLDKEPLNHGNSSKLDLDLSLVERFDSHGEPDGISGVLLYSAALYDEATIQHCAGRFEYLMEAASQKPDECISSLVASTVEASGPV